MRIIFWHSSWFIIYRTQQLKDSQFSHKQLVLVATPVSTGVYLFAGIPFCENELTDTYFCQNFYMPRVKIHLPDVFSFNTEVPVRITDVNYGGHVGNDAILGIIHEARLQFLKHHGFSEMDFGGCGLIMADVAIEFKQEAFYGDLIYVSVAANDFGRVSFDICYKLEKETEGKRSTVAIAKTGMVCFNYQQRKVCPAPDEALKKIGK